MRILERQSFLLQGSTHVEPTESVESKLSLILWDSLPRDYRNCTLKKSVTLSYIILQMVALMHKERITTFPGSNPQHVETVLKTQVLMF